MSDYTYLTNQLKIAEHEWQTYYKVSENMAKLLCERDAQIKYLNSVIAQLTMDKADRIFGSEFDVEVGECRKVTNEQWGNQ